MIARLGTKIQCIPAVKLIKGKTYPLIDMEKIIPGQRQVSEFELSEYTGQSCSKFCSGDTIMARITPCLENGKVAQYTGDVKEAFGSTELFVFRGMTGETDSDYVYYLMSTQYIRDMAVNSMTGASGRQRADIDFIKKIKLDFPSLPTQHRIADILSAYDALIENNTKRIKLLEQMAGELYKEWFVRFRFPGYKTAEFEGGKPQEWKRHRLKDMIDFDPVIKMTKANAFKIIPMAALDTTGMLIDEAQIEISEDLLGSRNQNNDTLLARITPCLENGKTGFVQCLSPGEVAGGSTEFIVMRSKGLNPYLVYFISRDQVFREYAIKSMNGADGRQRVKSNYLEKLWWLLPPDEIIDAFEEKVKGCFSLIHSLSKQNKYLVKQRDLLLPRLMSGKLGV